MAEVVELFGAPGTGKSSIAGALDGRRIAGRRVVAAERLRRVARRAAGTVSPGAPAGAPLPRRVLERLVRRDRTTEERRQLVEDRTDWSGLLGLLLDAPLGREGPDPLALLQAPGWMLATLEARALADAAPDDLIVVLDEGLVQRVRLVCGDAPDDARLARYVAALPPARLQVHLTADTGTLVARLQARERTIDRHRGLDAAALATTVARDASLLASVAAELRGRGDTVLDVSTASGDPEDAVRAVLDQLASALP